MQPISVMIKPASGMCNLECKYCFYHSLSESRKDFSHGFMTEETIEAVISKALFYADGAIAYFSFQGGEPLLRGKEFFGFVVKCIQKYNYKNSNVVLAVQTNGTLIDEEWAKFFADNKVLVGISLDGNGPANNNRTDKEGNPSFQQVLRAIKLLDEYKVQYNILTVVTKYVAQNIESIYKFFTSRGYNHLQFINCLPPLGENSSDNKFYMTSKDYGEYLLKLFNLYSHDLMTGRYVSIRQLDNFILRVAGKPAEQCGMNGTCSRQFVIEGDGSIYPCDFYCLDEYCLGNINEIDYKQCAENVISNNFIKESQVVEEKCKSCAYYGLCKNGCKRERGAVGFCDAYKYFFPRAIPKMQRIAVGLGLMKPRS